MRLVRAKSGDGKARWGAGHSVSTTACQETFRLGNRKMVTSFSTRKFWGNARSYESLRGRTAEEASFAGILMDDDAERRRCATYGRKARRMGASVALSAYNFGADSVALHYR
jgi:hypothetical protein